MYQGLINILTESAVNETVHVLVITGRGDFYSSGNDFMSFATDESVNIEAEMAKLEYVTNNTTIFWIVTNNDYKCKPI